jgi:hypothetical protein
MAIQGPDARILGAITTPKINTPFENLDQVLGMRERQQQSKARDVAIRQKDAELRETEALRQTLATLDDLSPDSINRVIKAAPLLGPKWAESLADQRKKAADAAKVEYENDKLEGDVGLGLIAVARANPKVYADLLPAIQKHLPQLAQTLPPVYDEAALDAVQQFGMTQKERLDRGWAAFVALGKGELATFAAALAAEDDPEERAAMLDAARGQGVPKRVLDLLAKDPTAYEMTPAARADDRRQDAAQQAAERRDQAAAEERAIDNKRADAQLGVSQAQLQLARQREGRAAKEAASGGGQKPLTQTAEAAMINRLAGQWEKSKGSMSEINRQVAIMDQGLAAGRRGDLPQANEAVLQTFLKILDPNSVVREGEFARLVGGASLLTRAEAALQRIRSGGALPMSELEKYARLAKDIQAVSGKAVDPVRERIGKTADRYNIPRDLVLDAGAPAGGGEQPAGGQQFTVTAPNGKTYVFPTQAQADVFKKRAGIK